MLTLTIMKSKVGLTLLVLCLHGIGAPVSVHAIITNPSFDDGLNGWEVTRTGYDWSSSYAGGGGSLNLSGGMGNQESISVYQTFQAVQNTLLSGRAIFTTYCPWTTEASTHAKSSITINGAEVWARSSGTVPVANDWLDPRTVGWENWDYVLPTGGEFTISFNVWGCQFGSYASFDGLFEAAPSPSVGVPDSGSTGLLLGIGVAAVLASRRTALRKVMAIRA